MMNSQKFKTLSGQTLPHIALAALLTTTLFGTSACKEDTETTQEPPTQSRSFKLLAAQNCQTLGERLVDATTEQILRSRYEEIYLAAEDAAAGGNNAERGGDDGPSDYTTTNNQEVGVDEADIIKSDGKFIYTVVEGDLVILNSWPAADTHEAGRITLSKEQNSWPAGLFLRGDEVVTFSSLYDYSTDAQGNYIDHFSGTRINVVDISDRTNPTLKKQIDIEGWYSNARMIDGDIYMVSNAGVNLPFDYWSIAYNDDVIPGLPDREWDASPERMEELKNQARPLVRNYVRQQLNGHNVPDMLPRKRIIDAQGQIALEEPLYSCTDMYIPAQITESGVLNITHVDLDQANTPIESTGLLANGWNVYASQDNLYISMTSGSWWWGWGSQTNESHIHKFALDGPQGEPRYAASGKVDGWILNQFSLSEYNGHLRVATTDNDWTWNEATQESEVTGGNHLTILKEEQGELIETGAVRDLAPGERIYSARMMGDRGYMVTFRQTDPLYTFDLSDPTNPTLEGELKINGFSSYMPPMGPDHLLTIGQDADDDGRVKGVHLQIFDVSDMKNPTRTAQHVISTGSWSSWSEAMWDHHAFTYHPGRDVLAVPVNIYEWEENNNENFSGLILFSANEQNGISEIGRVNHTTMASDYYCAMYPQEDWACNPESNGYRWWTSIRRSMFIEDYVFSFSDIGVKVNALNSPDVEYQSIMLKPLADATTEPVDEGR